MTRKFNLESKNDWSNCLQAKAGKHKEVEAVLQRLRGNNVAAISEEAAEIKVIFNFVYFESLIVVFTHRLRVTIFFSYQNFTETFQQDSERILDLFQWRYAHSLTVSLINRKEIWSFLDIGVHLIYFSQVGVGLILLQQFSGNIAIISYASSIFSDAGK